MSEILKMSNCQILHGDCLEVLKTMSDKSVHCCVTSPPYYGLRDYGVDGQIGLEETPEQYVQKLVKVFREVKRVLRDEGILWLNLGDSYASGKGTCFNPGGGKTSLGQDRKSHGVHPLDRGNKSSLAASGLKPKDLIGIPWRVAFALQADGWYLRQDIIWSKPNPMPESVKDRCTKSHEYIFLLSKSHKYYFDNEVIKEPIKDTSIKRLCQNIDNQTGSSRIAAKINGNMKAIKPKDWNPSMGGGGKGFKGHSGNYDREGNLIGGGKRNKRSVWTVTTKPYKGAHFATYPPDLIEPCVLAGSPVGGIILDPFNGSGTTGEVALKHGRSYIGIEINAKYIRLSYERLHPYIEQERLFA